MQGNGQKCNNEWCPNTIFSNGSVSIGEFKTLEEAMNLAITYNLTPTANNVCLCKMSHLNLAAHLMFKFYLNIS